MENEFYFNINEYDLIDIGGENTRENEDSLAQSFEAVVNGPLIMYDFYIDDSVIGPILSKLKNKNSHSEKVKQKIRDIILTLVGGEKIDSNSLNQLIFEGIPDEFPGVRSILWKIKLGYLPNKVSEWKNFLIDRRVDYENIKMDFIGMDEFNTVDEKAKFVMSEIMKDVKRTRMQMHFFGSKTKLSQTNETHSDVLARILLIFAMCHPEISYVQGMNEILAPIYYCFAADPNSFFLNNLEADVFYCFENLILEIKDIFKFDDEKSETCARNRIKYINKLLKITDIELYRHFIEENIELEYFMFRWLTLLFTQEYSMPDILRLWDSILTQVNKVEYVSYLCLSVLRIKKDLLSSTDFSNIIYLLQHLNALDLDVEALIKTSLQIKYELSVFIAN